MKYCFLLVLVLGVLVLPSFYCNPAWAEVVEPLVAMILNEGYEDVGTDYEMPLNGSVTLFGVSTGGYLPFYFSWYVDGVATPTYPDWTFVYAATEVGEHSLVLVVDDSYWEQSSLDTVLIQVYDPALPVSPTTWGSIKALFGE